MMQKENVLESLKKSQSGVHADLHLGIRAAVKRKVSNAEVTSQIKKLGKSVGARDRHFTSSPLSPKSMSSLPI
jgi:hypothetical protein